MAYLDEDDVKTAYQEASDEADQWRLDYPQYERLADNGLLDDLDENLPEVNDGSLAASLFKLSKRVIRKKIGGQAIAMNRDEAWINELANIYWNKKILPNANSKATPRRKWKDAVRKAAIYGGQPVIDLFITRGNYTGSDFIVPYAQDVKLEAGKDSDQDSDIIFWDVYYSKSQLEDMLATAEKEIADGISQIRDRSYDDQDGAGDNTALGENADTHKPRTSPEDAQTPAKRSKVMAAGAKSPSTTAQATDPDNDNDNDTSDATDTDNDDDQYGAADTDEPQNYWDIDLLKEILASDPEEQRPGNETPKAEQTSGQKKTGYHFYVAWQRGVEAPFMMIHSAKGKCVREWVNDDPTGDIPCHYLYCYQDFINPYGIGIVKLAGGTQNVLDYMRQADILATQLGLRPPKQIIGDEDQVDEDSLVYAQDANWYVGSAKVERMEMANGVYSQLPGRINMYQTSLQKMLPTGDTTISETSSGDSSMSKTPAGVKLAAANLSIDDEDFAENVDECYAMVARRMINCQFANMEGTDLLKLSDDERDTLVKAGLPFPVDANGRAVTNELQLIWDHTRAHFDFEIDPSTRFMTSDAEQQTLLETALQQATPQVIWALGQAGWKFSLGEAYYAAFSKMNLENFASIISKMTDEEAAEAKKQPFPIIDPPQMRLTGQIPSSAMAAALGAGGVQVDPSAPDLQDQIDLGDVLHFGAPTAAEKAQILQKAGITPSPVDPATADQPPVDPNAASTPAPADTGLTANEAANLSLKADQQAHDQNMDKTKLALEITKAATPEPAAQVPGETKTKATAPSPAKTPATGHSDSAQIAAKASGDLKQIMSLYHVDANTAMAMLEAERQGYSPEEILLALSRHQIGSKRGGGSDITPSAPAPADLPTGAPVATAPAPGGAR